MNSKEFSSLPVFSRIFIVLLVGCKFKDATPGTIRSIHTVNWVLWHFGYPKMRLLSLLFWRRVYMTSVMSSTKIRSTHYDPGIKKF